MLDEILHFAFFAVVESIFFRVGCWVIRLISLGNVTVSSKRPIVTFTVSLLGLAATLVLLAVSIGIVCSF